MARKQEFKHFPELHDLPDDEKANRLTEAKALAFGPNQKLTRWRGNIMQFAIMFIVSVLFMVFVAPALSLSQDASALIMLFIILPLFFILQQRRYIQLVRQALAKLNPPS
ncbi:hypothetical protein [Gilvimarinus sp. 1_MG-2023]|uniref:hypothetical protein n=1 Tax=Gilvimarinus sp. 1_MG-2023 TaxID=3062638 RepID=UPI0026E49193|nr:hypothetical protein [Gilvimarinus sp. 1_MG-2023]MDO6748414.1 hypothetical protein [Gilvimarinus sp. 1_MG-2023]